MTFTKLTIIGHLGQDAELKATPQGLNVSQWSMATSRKRNNVDETTWFRCSLFGDSAPKLNQYLSKGKLVHVEGRLKNEIKPYQSKDGSWKASYEVFVDHVTLLGGGNGNNTNTEATNTPNEILEF